MAATEASGHTERETQRGPSSAEEAPPSHQPLRSAAQQAPPEHQSPTPPGQHPTLQEAAVSGGGAQQTAQTLPTGICQLRALRGPVHAKVRGGGSVKDGRRDAYIPK